MEFMMAILWHKRPSGFFELFCGLVLMCALSLAPSRAFADHAVHEVKGDHGLWAWVLPEKDVSFTQIAISFEGGVAAEKEDESGLAALYATILEMSHGQEDNEIEFSRLLQRLGIQVNYSAGVEEIHVSVSIFSEGKSEKVSKAFKFLKDIFRKPPLSSEVIRRAVRESIAERHNADSNAEYQARNLWYAKFYKGHRYGVPLNGDIDVIKDISTRYAKRSWSRFFNRENVNIVIVGEIDDTSVKEWLDHYKPTHFFLLNSCSIYHQANNSSPMPL
jgi:predicted Zn-dependent peptidase